MSDLIKPDPAAVDDAKTATRRSLRRKRGQEIVEADSRVEKPNTVPVFQASPTSVAGVLATHGVALDGTLSWSRSDETAVVGKPALTTEAPVFVVGAGREFLAELLDAQPGLDVGFHGDALVNMTRAIKTNWSSLVREGYPEQYWYKKVAGEFAADRASHAGERRWVEVVDTTDLPLETLDRLFPRCVIINVVGGWLQGGLRSTPRSATLPASRYLEVRLSDVKADPAGVEARVLEFLGAA